MWLAKVLGHNWNVDNKNQKCKIYLGSSKEPPEPALFSVQY